MDWRFVIVQENHPGWKKTWKVILKGEGTYVKKGSDLLYPRKRLLEIHYHKFC